MMTVNMSKMEFKELLEEYIAKAGRIDHLWPIRLHKTYKTRQQVINSGFWWSIHSGQLW
jgi:hypothetical protein